MVLRRRRDRRPYWLRRLLPRTDLIILAIAAVFFSLLYVSEWLVG